MSDSFLSKFIYYILSVFIVYLFQGSIIKSITIPLLLGEVMGEVIAISKIQAIVQTSLPALFVKSFSEPGKYHDGGGIGLYLRVDPGGAKFWVQRIIGERQTTRAWSWQPSRLPLSPMCAKAALENKRMVRAGMIRLKPSERQRHTHLRRGCLQSLRVETSPHGAMPSMQRNS